MNLTALLTAALSITATLTNSAHTNPQKLEMLTDDFGEMIELADDAVVLLPGAIGSVAKLIVDNGAVDAWQREYIAKPLAEATYQVWLVANGAIEQLGTFAKSVAMPALKLINTLASNAELSNTERFTQLKASVLEGLKALTGGVMSLLPIGFQNLFKLLEGMIGTALDTLAGFIGEALYQVYKALHPNTSSETVIPAA